MQLFYGKPEGKYITLNQEESHHCIKVLRKNAGDELSVFDGLGNLFIAKIIDPHAKHTVLEVIQTTENWGIHPYNLQLAIAPTKMMDRMEWTIEKATELGINRITPILTSRSERKVVKTERLERIVMSAAKQSLKGVLPVIDELTPFKDFVKGLNREFYIAHCMDHLGDKPHLINLLNNPLDLVICVGPEGDFSEDEIKMALQHGGKAISLGNERMRTETAGLYCVQTAHIKSYQL